MGFSAELLWAVLEDNLPAGTTGLLAALCGGLDSSCLVAALGARPSRSRGQLPLRAVHVDHGLQAASGAMREAAAALCRRLRDSLSRWSGSTVDARAASRSRPRRAPRAIARSQSVLKPGECLLTAHHALDQAETLLLQLLRGAGLKGLSAMPLCRPFAHGWHLRPLLDVAPARAA